MTNKRCGPNCVATVCCGSSWSKWGDCPCGGEADHSDCEPCVCGGTRWVPCHEPGCDDDECVPCIACCDDDYEEVRNDL